MSAKRFNQGKPSLSYILKFVNPMKAISRIMEFGAVKYGEDNWKLGGKPDREYLDSMMRHLTAWTEGEVYDQDSGCSHLGHAIWNLLALHELNHPSEVIDEEIFNKQCEIWKHKKLDKKFEPTQEVHVAFEIKDKDKLKPFEKIEFQKQLAKRAATHAVNDIEKYSWE